MNEEDREDMVEIKKWYVPDLVLTEERKSYSSIEYFKLKFLFSEEVCVELEVDEEGHNKRGWSSERYIACKREGDRVMVMDPKHGWMIHKKATEMLADQIADKELLS